MPGTIRDNPLPASPGATDEELRRVPREVRPAEKVDALDEGLDTPLSGAAVSGVSGSASPWPGPCRAPRTSCSWTRRRPSSTG
ncbi:hypothetical protein [Streptomyces sp. WAC04114]|uniref:hypothetical protein n=1 Tax=Streptomyces sp. WAC04114 TaxID=2867961 RepID=UPI0027E14BF2|nr:hypothetical protein [Streptomyces sp. WAC04114]